MKTKASSNAGGSRKPASVRINSDARDMRHRDPSVVVDMYWPHGDGTQLEDEPWHLVSDKEQNHVTQWETFKTFFEVSQKN